MTHIFISYSRIDKDSAYKIQRQLEAQGFDIWIDKKDIPPGASFTGEISKGIRSAAAFLILWSQNAAESDFVSKEIEEALNQKMMRSLPIIPVQLDDHPLRPQLESLQAVDLTTCSNDKLDNLIGRLGKESNQLHNLRYRRTLDFAPNKPLGDQGATPLKQLPSLVSLPIVESIYCKGRMIATPDMCLTAVRNHPAKTIQVYLEFLGAVDNEDSISKIYHTLQSDQPDNPFFMFHFTGHQIETEYMLTDDPADSPHGDWLDPVNTIYVLLRKTHQLERWDIRS